LTLNSPGANPGLQKESRGF